MPGGIQLFSAGVFVAVIGGGGGEPAQAAGRLRGTEENAHRPHLQVEPLQRGPRAVGGELGGSHSHCHSHGLFAPRCKGDARKRN